MKGIFSLLFFLLAAELHADSSFVQVMYAEAPLSEVRYAEFSPDSRFLIGSFADGSTRLWDVTSGKLLRAHYQFHKGPGKAIFSPDGSKYLIDPFGTDAHEVYETSTGNFLYAISNSARDDIIVWSPDSKSIMLRLNQGPKAEIYDAMNGRLLYVLQEAAYPWSYHAQYSSGGHFIAIAYTGITRGMEMTVVYNTADGKELYRKKNELFSCFNSDGSCFVTRQGRFYRSSDGARLMTQLKYDSSEYRDYRLLANGLTALDIWPLNFADKHYIDVLDVLNGGLKKRMPEIYDADCLPAYNTFEISGERLYVTSGDSIRCINTRTGEELQSIRDTNWCNSFRLSPDGRMIVNTHGPHVKIWDTRTGRLLLRISCNSSDNQVSSFSSDIRDEKIIITFRQGKRTSINFKSAKITALRRPARSAGHDPAPREYIYRIYTDTAGYFAVHFNKIMIRRGSELITFFFEKDGNWLVSSSEGYFDANRGMMKKLYFVKGTQIISLKNYKKKYYRPGFWKLRPD